MSEIEKVSVRLGDCLEVLATLPENSVDSVVTDPPYELGFMGKSWDASGVAFSPDTWRQVMRVLKPGGHMVAFGAPKNYHRLACAIEDAGFEIRDSLMWIFGSGFPKSLDVSKAIDATLLHGGSHSRMIKKAIADRPGEYRETATLPNNGVMSGDRRGGGTKDEPATDAAREWSGWGTALKPAYEPVVLARKPLSEGTVAANVLRWGTGAINVGATKVGSEILSAQKAGQAKLGTFERSEMVTPEREGRWPANLAHDGSDEVLEGFPSEGANSPARFFYCAKANKHDRAGSKHPTVKPVALMQWLVRMVTPPGGTVLDPFAGSGTTGQAAINESFPAILIEREQEYHDDIIRRLTAASSIKNLLPTL